MLPEGFSAAIVFEILFATVVCTMMRSCKHIRQWHANFSIAFEILFATVVCTMMRVANTYASGMQTCKRVGNFARAISRFSSVG